MSQNNNDQIPPVITIDDSDDDMTPPPVLTPQNISPPPSPTAKRARNGKSPNNNNIARPPVLDLYVPENDEGLNCENPDFEWDNFGYDWNQQGDGPTYPLEHYYEVTGRDQSRGSRSRRSHVENTRLILRNLEDHNGPLEPLLVQIFRLLINNAIDAGHATGYNGQPRWIAAQINNENFREPFYVPLRPPQQNSAESIVASLTWLQGQYGDELHIFDVPLTVRIQAIWALNENQNGTGGCAFEGLIPGLHGRKPRSLIVVENEDSYCMARAICIGIKWLLCGTDKKCAKRYAVNQARVGHDAVQLLQDSGCRLNLPQYNFRDAQKIANFLNEETANIRIVVMDADCLFKVVFKSSERPMPLQVVLLLHHQHYDFIGEPKHLFQCEGYCVDCERRATPKVHHYKECKWHCRLCYRYGDGFPCQRSQDNPGIKCERCLFIFPNRSCFDYHRQRGEGQYSICDDRWLCRNCGALCQRRGLSTRPHRCPDGDLDTAPGECESCAIVHDKNHPFCYIQQLEADDDKPIRYIFFDVETSQEDPLDLNNGEVVNKHWPVLVVVEILCNRCMDQGIGVDDNDARAAECVCGVFGSRFRHRAYCVNNVRRRIAFHCFDDFEENPAAGFLDFLLKNGTRKVKDFVISHNGGKVDMYFILELLFQRGIAPKVVVKGLKFYSISINGQNRRKICFKDSLNFFSSSLAALHKTFDLGREGVPVKPWFPYLFIKRENLNTRHNCLPAVEYYDPDHMKPEDRSRFLQWHKENRNQPFLLREALIEYCTNDVTILTKACMSFRRQLLAITRKLDPFVSSSTIAKLTLNIFRAEFLRQNVIVNLPEGGINLRGRQSHEALMFFRTMERRFGWQIRTAEYTMGEVVAPEDPRNGSKYRIDGYVELEDGPPHLALEFYGCFYHGCVDCYPDRETVLADGKTAEELLARTEARAHHLRQHYRLQEVWECKWREKLRRDPELKAAYAQCFVPPPLNPRKHALRGGRTEAFAIHITVADDEVIEYVDVISMYPWCMKYGVFPVGQPKLVVVNELPRGTLQPFPWSRPEQNPFKGLILCRVLPPESMTPSELHPLLPYHSEKNKKLFFPLCAMCCDTQNITLPCPHTDQQRSWVSGYTHLEINKALELGYRLLDVYEAEHYEQWSSRQDNDLFGDFIDACLKIKQQASGWPSGVQNSEHQRQYIDEFRAAEGIQLDEAMIKLNPGLRGIAKLLLNSSWGKFCQQVMVSEVKYTTTARATHDLLENNQLEVTEVLHLNEQVDRVVFKHRPHPGNMTLQTPPTNNLTIGCYVTSQARLKLFSIFEEAVAKRNKPFYSDTDSAMVKRKITDPPLKLGKNLGDLSKELSGRRIVEVIILGAKHYAIRHVDAQTGGDEQYLIKVRGITLTHAARKLITFETMKKLAFQKYGEPAANEEPIEEPSIHFPQISRDKYGRIFTREAHKRYRMVFDKRIVINLNETVPFGTK